jgi:NADH-quinone oxidoreductase subunit J
MTVLLFFVFAVLAVLGAIGVLTCRNPLHCAVSMVGTMVSLAVIYLLHHAEFIFAIQLMVYAGAVMMLVVFVIMLLDLQREESLTAQLAGSKFLVPLGARLTGVIGDMSEAELVRTGSVEFIAAKLFGPYLLPFEVASVLLLVGLVGAVALAKKRL